MPRELPLAHSLRMQWHRDSTSIGRLRIICTERRSDQQQPIDDEHPAPLQIPRM